jgi:hypothetical protein
MSREAAAGRPPTVESAPPDPRAAPDGPIVLGFLMALGFVVLSAGRDVHAEQVAHDPDIPIYFDLAIGFFPAALLAAMGLAVPAWRPAPKGKGHALREVGLINFTTLVIWRTRSADHVLDR